MDNDSSGRSFHVRIGRQPGKPGWLATVVNLTGGTARRLVPDLSVDFLAVNARLYLVLSK